MKNPLNFVLVVFLMTEFAFRVYADPPAATTSIQEAYIKASNTGESGKNGIISGGDLFGLAVSISGDTMVIGAPGEDSPSAGVNGGQGDGIPGDDNQDSGAVYVFIKSNGIWVQQAYLKASNPSSDFFGDAFGVAVAIDGDVLVVGSPAEDSLSITDQSNNEGNRAGAAYVFVRSGTTWTQQAYLKPSNPSSRDQFGSVVDICGDTIVVSAFFEDSSTTGVNSIPNEDAEFSGAVYVFKQAGSSWIQEAYLKASNTDADDGFGSSISLDGDTLAVGASGEDSAAGPDDNSLPGTGAAYVFVRTGSIWSHQAYLKPSLSGAFYSFGNSISVCGNTLAVGTPNEDIDGNFRRNNGATFVFTRTGSSWVEEQILRSPAAPFGEQFGETLAMEGNVLLVGAPLQDATASLSGAAYLFLREAGVWVYSETLKASNIGDSDMFTNAVALDGCNALIGASLEDGGGIGINPSANDTVTDAGAAYLFTLAIPPAAANLQVTSLSLSNGEFTIEFEAQNGLTGWLVKASTDLTSFPLNLTTSSVITETAPGSYQAVVDVSSQSQSLFIRIESSN